MSKKESRRRERTWKEETKGVDRQTKQNHFTVKETQCCRHTMHVKKYAESNPCLKSLDFDSVAFLFNEIGFAGL